MARKKAERSPEQESFLTGEEKNDRPTNVGEREKPMSENKNFTHIKLKDGEGNVYTLEFNRRVVERMERNGFKIDTDYPNTMIRQLFQGAFQMHHRFMQPERIEEIWKQQNNKDKLLEALTKLYMKPLEDLMADPGEGNENPTWETD